MALSKWYIRLVITTLILTPLLLTSVKVEAGVAGKISGIVVNSENGEPLIGATIRVLNTNLVTKTDEDGEYFMISVPIGRYDLLVTYVGYEEIVKKEVRVLVDLTTPVDFSVAQVAVEISNKVVVYAKAPIIQKDLTSSRAIFTEERLRNLPNINSIQTILTNYPGVVTDRNSSLHIRGGRSGQVSYYYDGFLIEDPFTSSAGMRIIPTALEELSLLSGGFAAEYGEAQSGIVSAVTREGGALYDGKVRIYQGATHQYDVNTANWGKLSKIPERSASFNFSGPMPGFDTKSFNFFTAGEYLRDESSLPHNWGITYTGMAKLTMQPIAPLRLKSNIAFSKSDGAGYTHSDVNGVSYDFNLDGLPLYQKNSSLFGLTGNYSLNNWSIISLTINQFSTKTLSAPEHLMDVHWSNWPGYSEDSLGVYNGTIHKDNYLSNVDYTDPAQANGFTTGADFDPTYAFRKTRYNSISGNLVAQFNRNNELKAGFEYRRYSVEWDFKQFYNSNPFGEKYSNSPSRSSLYLEDKVEYKDFVINAGIRYDYNNADIAYNNTPQSTEATYKQAESKSRFSPRLGVSFPVSDKTVLHFNYGLYYQVPSFVYLYTNIQGDVSSGLPLLGNPDLDPEVTTSFELGLDHLIGQSLRMDLTAYYKDINDLVSTRKLFERPGTIATKFINADYGTVTGFDLSLEKLPSFGYLSGSISYGFMMAKGNGSSPYEPYYSYITSVSDTLAPVTEFTLDFDQRHTLTALLDYRVPADWSGNIMGLNIPGAWGISMVGYYGSGLPFTKTDSKGGRLGGRNENRLPTSKSVDMRFNKDFFLFKHDRIFTFFVEVDNLFDERNVLNVYTNTGLPDNDGRNGGTGLAQNVEEDKKFDQLYQHDPQNFSSPRTVRTGFEFSF